MLEELWGLIESVDDEDDYWVRLHSVDDTDDMFEAGHGKLANGPAFLIDAYGKSLQGEGTASYVTEESLPRKDPGATLATLFIDDTFVVASRLEELRVNS
jgi:hypothetical protein